MVRVFDPRLIPALDDNRLPAAHAETHYIMAALVRGEGIWWLHPETQRFYRREAELRYCHNQLVLEMARRGLNHGTAMSGRAINPAYTLSNAELDAWLQQDCCDLQNKWIGEGRTRAHSVATGALILGAETIGRTKSGKSISGFRAGKGGSMTQGAADAVNDVARGLWHQVGRLERTWGKEDSATLKALVTLERRTGSLDPDACRDWLRVHGNEDTDLRRSVEKRLTERLAEPVT